MSQFGYANPITVPQRGPVRANGAATAKTIPFDYVFQFALQGKPKNKVQDVVEISTEGVFVALSVGYSLLADEKSTARPFQPVINQTTTSQSPILVPIFPSTGTATLDGALIIGRPGADIAVLSLNSPDNNTAVVNLPIIEKSDKIGSNGTVVIEFPSPIQPGRVLQIWDRTNDLLGQLFGVGNPMTPVIGPNPEGKLPAAGDTVVFVYGSPTTGDDVDNNSATVSLIEKATANLVSGTTGTPFERVEISPGKITFRSRVELKTGEEIPRPRPLSPGDLLFVRTETAVGGISLPFSTFIVTRPRTISDLTLDELEAGLEKSGGDLTRGFRMNPASTNLAGIPISGLSQETLGRAFETGCVAAEEVSFLYSLDVGNTGREYQSKAIHNIAGLGIANGDRPFRPFAKPIMFEPRSFIRIQVEELSGPPGTLFIVLQGYKMLGTGRIPV